MLSGHRRKVQAVMGRAMRGRILVGLAWTLFAALIVGIGAIFLAACDLRIKPLFALRYCRLTRAEGALVAERQRERELKARVQEAELRIAQLPACPQDTPRPEDQLRIPARLDQLKGCWQSLRGDVDIVTDDPSSKPIGKVRICYCLGAGGRGKVRWLFTDGQVCEGDLTAQTKDHALVLNHGEIPCARQEMRHLVAEEISCRADPGEAASCDAQSLGTMRRRSADQKYQRVSDEYCNRHGPS
jgi:hypothetical protein